MTGYFRQLFKFSWKIDNLSLWDSGRIIKSPTFVVEELGNEAFFLEFKEKGKNPGFCSLFLTRADSDGAADKVTLKFAFGISPKNISRKSSDVTFDRTKTAGSFNSWGFANLIEKAQFFEVDDWFLLSGDMKIECTIFEADGNKPDTVKPEASKNASLRIDQCSARTLLKSEEISLKWNIKHFSKLAPEEKVTTEISFPEDSPCFLVTLYICSCEDVENVQMCIEILRKPGSEPTFVACKVSFDDTSGVRVVKTDKHVYNSDKNAVWKFPALADRRQLIPEKSEFLPKDILSLLLEFKVCDGIEFSKVGKTVYGSVSRPPKPGAQELTPLKENSLRMFKEQQTCDVSFETSTKTIRAHKFILFANSSVFKAMFDHETVEKQTDTIRVADISFETLERFLAYLYIERLEGDVDAQLAMELYVAADKYQVDSLKEECSRFLKKNLQAENVCAVLSMADRHQDSDLKDSVRVFFSRCKAQVLGSDEWKEFRLQRPQFAVECLEWLCNS